MRSMATVFFLGSTRNTVDEQVCWSRLRGMDENCTGNDHGLN